MLHKLYALACIFIICCINVSHGSIFTRKLFNRIGKPPIPLGAALPPDEWFTQKLDHFDSKNSNQFLQRFFKNEQHFSADSNTVFLMIGGEGKASPEWMVAGQWIEYAKKLKALCFLLEHRYYGKSHPVPDMGIKNLQYLSSEQALADLANFITAMNKKYKFDSRVKWVVFGGSYPGSLAAWMRLKYSNLVHAAVSSSGPLLAQADFMEYYKVVVDSLRTSSDECVDAIKAGTRQLGILLRHMVGQRSINDKFRLCEGVENASKLDISSLYESLASNFAGVVQYNKDNRIGESAKLSNITIDVVCRIMSDEAAGSALDRLANVNAMLLQANNETCLDYKYDNMIQTYRNFSWNSSASEGGRQWMYQTCNEFGFYQTSGGEPEIFSNQFTLDFFIQQCIDIFGPKYNLEYISNAIAKTNTLYGALDIEATRIVFVHGSVDPWHILGITETMENDAPALYIEGTAHCANMYPARDEDLPQLKAARVMILDLLETWLKK